MASNAAGDTDFGWLMFWRKADFKTVEQLGRGGFGVVKKMRHPQLKLVAVKTLEKRTLKDSQNWLKEIGVLACVHHEHIISIFGCYVDGDKLAIVMELAAYKSAETLMGILDPPEAIPMSITVRILLQVSYGMSYLHLQSNDILHLDLKAANVLITRHLSAKITDFGLAEWRTYPQDETVELELTAEDERSGTWTHVPPEILKDRRLKPCRKFDVYSFAILMWEMLSGKPATDGFATSDPSLMKPRIVDGERPDVKMLREESPPDAKELMTNCWNKDFQQRPYFSEITKTMNDIYVRYQGALCSDEKSLRKTIAEHQGTETLNLAEDSSLPDPTPAEKLHQRVLKLAKQQITEQLQHPDHVAAMLSAWEMLDLKAYISKLKSCKSIKDRAAALLSIVERKDEVTTLALLSALSLTGQDELVNRVYLSMRPAATDLKQDKVELTWWMLVLKMDKVDNIAEALAINGFINSDVRNVIQAQPTRLQQAHALLCSVLSSKKNGEEFLWTKLKTGQVELLQDSDSLDQLCTLWSTPFLSRICDASTPYVRKPAASLSEPSSAYPPIERSNASSGCLENEDESNFLGVYSKEFDGQGGFLCTEDKSLTLKVPPGALKSPQILHLKILSCDNQQGFFSMLFEFGPSGLHFDKPVELSVPHSAPSTEHVVAAVKSAGSKTFVPSDWAVKTEAGRATISLRHFSMVALMAPSFATCSRHWWLFACRRVPLFVFGFFYPDTQRSRIYCAYMYNDLYEVID